MTVGGVFCSFSPIMALFTSIFCVNDESASARLNWAQPITIFDRSFLLTRGLAECERVTVSTGMGRSAFSCLLSVRAESQDVDLVLGSDWFSLYSAATWSSDRCPIDQPLHSDRAVGTGRRWSSFPSLTRSNSLQGQLTHLMAFGFRAGMGLRTPFRARGARQEDVVTMVYFPLKCLTLANGMKLPTNHAMGHLSLSPMGLRCSREFPIAQTVKVCLPSCQPERAQCLYLFWVP